MRLLSGRDGRRSGWRQPLRSLLLRSLRVPGTGARSSDSSQSPGPGGGPRAPGLPLSPASLLAPPNFSRRWDPAPTPVHVLLSRGKAGTASRLRRRVPLPLPRRGETRILRPRRGKPHSALLFGSGPGLGCGAKRFFLLPCPGIRCFSRHRFQGRPGAHRETRALGGRAVTAAGREGRRKGGNGASGGRAPAGDLPCPSSKSRGGTGGARRTGTAACRLGATAAAHPTFPGRLQGGRKPAARAAQWRWCSRRVPVPP